MTKTTFINFLAFLTCFTLFPWNNALCATMQKGEGHLLAADGIKLFYRVVGTGPETVIVLHGGPGNTMESIQPDFEPLEQKYTLIYYDQRGNGRSELILEDRDLSISKHVEDIEAIRLHFNLPRISLIGNSWGGLLASFYAVKHPDRIEKLILHSSVSPSITLLRSFAGHIDNRIPADRKSRFKILSDPETWFKSTDPFLICREFYDILIPVYFSDPGRSAAMRGNVCAGSEEAVRRQQLVNRKIWLSVGEWDILPKLKVVTAPTLIISGKDDMLPLESSQAWARAFPNARLLVINDAGHLTHVEQPELFFNALDVFLQGDWPEGSINMREIPQSE